jgi:hypothetical protein
MPTTSALRIAVLTDANFTSFESKPESLINYIWILVYNEKQLDWW